MKGNEFNLSPREWRAKNKIDEAIPTPSKIGREMAYLRDNYYNISDGLMDIVSNIEHIASDPDGKDWEANNLAKGELNKEIKLFKQIQKLFNKSKLGKVL